MAHKQPVKPGTLSLTLEEAEERCKSCGAKWSEHTKDILCEFRSTEWFRGFEAAHELMECGHSRGDLRDPNWKEGQVAGNYSCVGCQLNADLLGKYISLLEDERPVHGTGVGSPAYLKLQLFGSVVWNAFGEAPYLVGSAIVSKQWRDVDVRLILEDAQYAIRFGNLHNHSGEKDALEMAFSELGKSMTGLPIDFQIQQRTDANARHDGVRCALGIVAERLSQPASRVASSVPTPVTHT